MTKGFSARLCALRHERGLSQKEAAEALGVSPALLSHYEKGIRECGLQFIRKAASFYDVSCDYLLGASDTRRTILEEYSAEEVEQDREFCNNTLLRASVMLSDYLAKCDGATAQKLRNSLALSLYRAVLEAEASGLLPKGWISMPYDKARICCSAALGNLSKVSLRTAEKSVGKFKKPVCLQTVIEHSEAVIREEVAALLESK